MTVCFHWEVIYPGGTVMHLVTSPGGNMHLHQMYMILSAAVVLRMRGLCCFNACNHAGVVKKDINTLLTWIYLTSVLLHREATLL